MRDAVAEGEYWRLLTGNLVHLGWRHLALNVGALLLGIWVFYPARTPVGWIVAQLVCSISSSTGALPVPVLKFPGVWACRVRCTVC